MCDNTPCNARYQKDSVGSIPTYLRQIWQVQIKFTRHKWSTHSIKEI